ncbi:glycosyltransferase, partial [Acinetobacter baumannii]
MKILHAAYMKDASSGIVNQMYWEQEAAKELGISWKSILFVQNPNGFHNNEIVTVCNDIMGGELKKWFKAKKSYYSWLEGIMQEYDVLIIRHSLCDPFEPFFIRKMIKPVYIMHHTFEIDELYSYNYGVKTKIKSLMEIYFGKKSISYSKGIVAVTKEIFLYENSRVNGKFKKEIVYPNGIISQHDIILDDRNDNIPEIVFIASYFNGWHGLDLLLHNLSSINDDFILHIVGDVSVEDELLAKKDSRVILHGHLNNIEISQLMSKMWIGLASFGLFRKGMKEACTLKVREYLNYGLPIYSGHKDIFPEEFEYYKFGEPKFVDILSFAHLM